jgi:hypothetical protein
VRKEIKNGKPNNWIFIQPVQEANSALDLIFDSINGIFGQ